MLGASPTDAPALAAAFHRGLVRAMVEVCCYAGVKSVALAGGCFQNALLRDLADTGLAATGFNVLAPRELPPNDGAIAAGQALGALWNLTTVEPPGNP
jgi:hydrogenase maturation protein HypF